MRWSRLTYSRVEIDHTRVHLLTHARILLITIQYHTQTHMIRIDKRGSVLWRIIKHLCIRTPAAILWKYDARNGGFAIERLNCMVVYVNILYILRIQ